MNGLEIILLVIIVSLFYFYNILFKKRMGIYDNKVTQENKLQARSFLVVSLIICCGVTIVLLWKIIFFTGKAQEDFGIFLTLLFYISPSVLLIFISLVLYIKYERGIIFNINNLLDPYFYYSIIVILLPIICYVFFEVVRKGMP